MPACEGRPDGPCPDRRNDTSVHFTQGDLFLCDACEKFRFPTKDRRTGSAGNRKTADPRGPRNNPVDGAVCPKNPDGVAASAMDATRSPDLILDELLSYVGFYRNKSNADNLRRIVLSFYSSDDIGQAKRLMVGKFSSQLSSCASIAERRNSSTRAAHEAEIEDILNMFDVLDLQCAFANCKFVASDLDKLPKYGPEEMNLASVVERQLRTEESVKNVAAAVEQLTATVSCANNTCGLDIESTSHLVDQLQVKLDSFSSSVCGRLDHLNDVCSRLTSAKLSSVCTPSKQPEEADRKPNLVIFGVAEDRDVSAWHTAVDNILSFVIGHHVDVVDMFRLGRFVASGDGVTRKPRPILVKLRTIWDKRVILSKCSKLKQYSQRGIFIAPDEPIETRRKNTLERLKYRAERSGQRVVITDGCLTIDDVMVFSLKDGYLRSTNG
jgi:hypothetical protein